MDLQDGVAMICPEFEEARPIALNPGIEKMEPSKAERFYTPRAEGIDPC
jgi:hypothetical protein